jgi:hypothetical protein
MRSVEKILVWKPEGKKPLRKPRIFKEENVSQKEIKSRIYRSMLAFNGRLSTSKKSARISLPT